MNILFRQILNNKEASALPGLRESGGLPALISGLSAVHRANLAAALAVRFLPVSESIVLIPLLGALAPSASNINQVAILYNRDAPYASAINVLTTLSCIATIPLWVIVFAALAG